MAAGIGTSLPTTLSLRQKQLTNNLAGDKSVPCPVGHLYSISCCCFFVANEMHYSLLLLCTGFFCRFRVKAQDGNCAPNVQTSFGSVRCKHAGVIRLPICECYSDFDVFRIQWTKNFMYFKSPVLV